MEEEDQQVQVHRFRWPAAIMHIDLLKTMKMKLVSGTTTIFLGILLLFILASTRWLDMSFLEATTFQRASIHNQRPLDYPKKDEYTYTCAASNMTLTCPANYLAQPSEPVDSPTQRSCPDYFRWIHEDLKPWKNNGITRKMVEKLEKYAHFRLTIVNGTAYVKQYDKAFQSRDVFTLWGILQLLRLYPGKLPDLDLMFQCHDKPSIKKKKYPGRKEAQAPSLFHYCGSDSTLDIVFPDWSFWGWPEINIKPWVSLMKDLEQGNNMTAWTDREPYAYWKGNLFTGKRKKLGRCDSVKDWNATIINQDWRSEVEQGFKNSDLSKQCAHRYKIYMEGNAWSVSNKYILACGSMTLMVNPDYYDFFSRSLVPMKHYWPIDANSICPSIKFAVNWGNDHPDKAQEIGRAGSKYIKEEVTMDNVYDYMFHVLDRYGELLNYRPTVIPGSVELCSETWGCSPIGLETADKIETTVKSRLIREPCTMPPPYEHEELKSLLDQNRKIKKQVAERGEQRGKR